MKTRLAMLLGLARRYESAEGGRVVSWNPSRTRRSDEMHAQIAVRCKGRRPGSGFAMSFRRALPQGSTLALVIAMFAVDHAAAQPVHFCQVNEESPFCTGGGGSAPIVDIADFEACGTEPDNSMNIQAAINYALTLGPNASVRFSCLSPIQAPVVIDSPGYPIALVGVAGGGIRLAADLSSYEPVQGFRGPAALLLRHCHNCLVYGMTFTSAPDPVSPRNEGTLLTVEASADVAIYYNTFKWVGTGPNGGSNAALFAGGNTNAEYFINTITDTDPGCRGMWIGDSSQLAFEPGCPSEELHCYAYEHGPHIEGNQISGTRASGIVIVAENGIVRENVVTDAVPGSALAVAAPHSEIRTKNMLVENNTFLRSGAGIQSDGSPDKRSENITVSGNYCDENLNSGIYIVNADNWTVTGNWVRNNNTNGGYDDGIRVATAHMILIEDNEVSNTQANLGIHVGANSTSAPNISCVTVRNNIVTGNPAGGIRVGSGANAEDQTVDSVDVLGNTLSANGPCNIIIGYDTSLPCGVSNVTVSGNSPSDSVCRPTPPVPCGPPTCSSMP